MTHLHPDKASLPKDSLLVLSPDELTSNAARRQRPTRKSVSVKSGPSSRFQQFMPSRPLKETNKTKPFSAHGAAAGVSRRQLAEGAVEKALLLTKSDVFPSTDSPVCPPLSPKVNILGMEFDNLTRQELLDSLRWGVVFTPNVDHLMKLRNDPELYSVYQKATFRVCDSQIVMYASKFLGKPLKAKLSGSDLFPWFCDHHRHNEQIKIFLLGGRPGVAKKAQARINARIGRDIVVGEYAPPFGFEHSETECDLVLSHIKRSGATVVAVCLGAPKQEKWIAAYCDRLPSVDIFMAVGAVVDFESGVKPRAPQFVSELGLEWLYRLVREPRRLWRRYLLEDMPFVWLVLAEKFKQLTSVAR
ncbi:MAG: WecB/TagA/CpsF family glycosyltransferase [Cyanobacteria bacterium J06560_2]